MKNRLIYSLICIEEIKIYCRYWNKFQRQGGYGVNMADIIGFPKTDLTPDERKRLEEFMREELAVIGDIDCDSLEELQNQFIVLAEYFRKFIAVFDDPDSKINPDLDFSLYLLEGRIRKIRGMIECLLGDNPVR